MTVLPAKRDGLELQDAGAEVLVHDPHARKIHVLNRTAADILRACDGVTAVDDFARRYPEVPAERIQSDVREVIGRFTSLGLLQA